EPIRHYGRIGLLSAPPRSQGRRRLYDEVHRRRLACIPCSRDLDLLDSVMAWRVAWVGIGWASTRGCFPQRSSCASGVPPSPHWGSRSATVRYVGDEREPSFGLPFRKPISLRNPMLGGLDRTQNLSSRARLEDMLAWVDGQVGSLPAENIRVAHAMGRVLAHDVTTAVDLPAYDRAAVDGLAVRADETVGANVYNPLSFRVVVGGDLAPAAGVLVHAG